MNVKQIHRRNRDWFWPEYDTELIKVFDQVDDIDQILNHCSDRGFAIQAGGACGVWPDRLLQEFETVLTFEPDAVNYECLTSNVRRDAGHLWAYWAALGEGRDVCEIVRHFSESTNAGAGYVGAARGGGVHVPVVSIDEVFTHQRFTVCDLICLDVEGAEFSVLVGGYLTIMEHKPTIVIEEKKLPQGGDYLAARRLLESWGYRQRAAIHRDVIFTHGPSDA